jgi:hypothetical protein
MIPFFLVLSLSSISYASDDFLGDEGPFDSVALADKKVRNLEASITKVLMQMAKLMAGDAKEAMMLNIKKMQIECNRTQALLDAACPTCTKYRTKMGRFNQYQCLPVLLLMLFLSYSSKRSVYP